MGISGDKSGDAGDGAGADAAACLAKLERYRGVVAESQLFSSTKSVLAPVKAEIFHFRCLALGSPTDSTAALYQLAYMVELQKWLGDVSVSVFDPVFGAADKRLFDRLEMSITESNDFHGKSTLWFLPHASLELTNTLLGAAKPQYLLANNLIAHTDRLTKSKLHEKYLQVSLAVNLLDAPKDAPKDTTSEFTVVEKKKRRNKLKFEPPAISYDYSHTYFSKLDQHVFEQTTGPWANAFTDLAYIHLS